MPLNTIHAFSVMAFALLFVAFLLIDSWLSVISISAANYADAQVRAIRMVVWAILLVGILDVN